MKSTSTMKLPLSNKKILYGICGIGSGHVFRQLPIVEYLAKENHQIVIFGYDTSLHFFNELSKKYNNIDVLPIEVPYYKGNNEGLDFTATADLPQNQKNFIKINSHAMEKASKLIGCPDIVISDYEPIVAQYAYAFDAPLITIDQQSKYLIGDFPQILDGQSYHDEVIRLRMFFPRADKRIACSFFSVDKRENSKESVQIFPPLLRNSIVHLKSNTNIHSDSPSYQSKTISIIIYFTAQQAIEQSMEDILSVLKKFIVSQSSFKTFSVQADRTDHTDRTEKIAQSIQTIQFSVFLPRHLNELPKNSEGINFYHHGDNIFEKLLAECHGVISTAGHTLLAECLYLNIPIYAIPLALYEQQMNAYIIEKNQFGILSNKITDEQLSTFIQNLDQYSNNIKSDKTVLLRNAHLDQIIQALDLR